MERTTDVLISLRRIIRAIDMRSRRLMQQSGLTGPQLMVLQALGQHREMSAGALAREINLSQGTVTSILDRLEKRGLIERLRSHTDRRKVYVTLTAEGERQLSTAPTLLQERFIERFEELKDWEQHQILASLQRLAEMMDAQDIDAAPVLETHGELGTVPASEEWDAAEGQK
ncbi:MAG: MarR family transcriptional regulator [Pseudomonadota bacterium]